MSEELWKLSAVKMAEGIRNREFSCEEVVNSVTNRIQKLNPRLNAVVGDLNPTAVDEAQKADRELESRKKATGPLHGVPVTVKCNVDVEGQPSTPGMSRQAREALPGGPPLLRQRDSDRFITEAILADPYAFLRTTAVWRRSNRHSAGFRPGFLRHRRNGACCPS